MMSIKNYLLSNDKKKNENIKLKIRFYIMSLWLLFFLFFLLAVDIPICFDEGASFIGWIPLLKRNWFATLSLFIALLGFVLALFTKYQWGGVTNPPYKISKISNENYEYLTFLTTYIIPLICIDLDKKRNILILFILLIIIGLIFVRMNLYYGNPALALMGYKLYRAEIDGLDITGGIVLISRDYLNEKSSIKWIKIDERVWVAKEIRNDK